MSSSSAQAPVIDEVYLGTDGDRLRVFHADPRIRVAAEILEEIEAGRHHADVTFDGEYLKINAVNQTVDLAEWPD